MSYRGNRKTLLERMFSWLFGVALVIVVTTIIITMTIAVGAGYKVVTADYSNGVQPLLEQLWCGKPGCLGKGSESK